MLEASASGWCKRKEGLNSLEFTSLPLGWYSQNIYLKVHFLWEIRDVPFITEIRATDWPSAPELNTQVWWGARYKYYHLEPPPKLPCITQVGSSSCCVYSVIIMKEDRDWKNLDCSCHCWQELKIFREYQISYRHGSAAKGVKSRQQVHQEPDACSVFTLFM